MANSLNITVEEEISETQKSSSKPEIEEIRQIIIGRERNRIGRLEDRLDRPEIRTREISSILPEAILLRTSRDDKVARSIGPAVETAIKSSIKKNPGVLADALFPIMGPSIRKAVTSAIQAMIQSLDKTLEHSLSLKGLKWRFEALRTKKSFGEIVLLNTLLYQVEQIFLIHNKTSVVLQHVVSGDVKTQDPDLVSGMLSAIRDFIHDSFNLDKEENLDSLHIGSDRTIWIEQGPHASLAAVIRGTPPEDLRSTLNDALESIHIRHSDTLETFEGDAAEFEAVRPDLEECLERRYKPGQNKISPLFWALLCTVALVLGIWCFYSVRDHLRVARYLESLKAERGILVTSSEKRSGKYYIYGLRDPFASDPAELLREEGLDPGRFNFKMESYNSTEPELVLKRINKILEPPDTVTLGFACDTLNIEGAASHQWIVKMKEAISISPVISHYDDKRLTDVDLNSFDALRKKIENNFFLFKFHSMEMLPGQEDELDAFIRDLKDLFAKAETVGKDIHVDIVGHSDSLGTETANRVVSKKRAEKILSIILREGFKTSDFAASGMGSSEPFIKERTRHDRELNRRVTIRVAG